MVEFPKTQNIELDSKQVNSSANASATTGVSANSNRQKSSISRFNRPATASTASSKVSGSGVSRGPGAYNAARANSTNRASDIGARSYVNDDSPGQSPRNPADHFSDRPQTFSGGTYAGSINRFQNEYRNAGPGSSNSADYNDNKKRSGSGIGWMLLALLLLLLLFIGYWFWPSANKDIKPIEKPEQSAATAYTSSSPARVAETAPPVSDAKPQTDQQTTPVPTEDQSNSAAETSGGASGNDSSAREVYRLEGKDVTVTVERNNPEQRAAAAGPSTTTAESDNNEARVQPGYHEFVHIVVKGDTLWDIAKKYLKNPFRYPELARLSDIKNPDLIYPGDTVRIRTRDK